jgi:hypothetical protein
VTEALVTLKELRTQAELLLGEPLSTTGQQVLEMLTEALRPPRPLSLESKRRWEDWIVRETVSKLRELEASPKQTRSPTKR